MSSLQYEETSAYKEPPSAIGTKYDVAKYIAHGIRSVGTAYGSVQAYPAIWAGNVLG